MTLLSERLVQTRDAGRAALVGYLPAGFPSRDGSGAALEAMEAFGLLCRTEGIIPAIESAHALAGAMRVGRRLGEGATLLVNLSGRGDKDVDTAARWFGVIADEEIIEAAEATVESAPGDSAGEGW